MISARFKSAETPLAHAQNYLDGVPKQAMASVQTAVTSASIPITTPPLLSCRIAIDPILAI